jgi:hypothetical protein
MTFHAFDGVATIVAEYITLNNSSFSTTTLHSFFTLIWNQLTMKSTTLFSLLLAGSTVQGGLVPPMVRDKEVNWNAVQKRQALGTLTWLMGA